MTGALVMLGLWFLSVPLRAHADTYLEIAVYEVDDASSFPGIRSSAIDQASARFSGLIAWTPLVDTESGYADILFWDTAGQAKHAAERMQTEAEFAPFASSISEISHFMHYSADADTSEIVMALEAGGFVELALYSVSEVRDFRPAQRSLHRILAGRQVPSHAFALDADEDVTGLGDLVIWPNVKAWQATGAELATLPELAPMFDRVARMHVFSLFTAEARP